MLNKTSHMCPCLLFCLSSSKNHLRVGGMRSYIPSLCFGMCGVFYLKEFTDVLLHQLLLLK